MLLWLLNVGFAGGGAVAAATFNPDTHDGGSEEDYRKLRQILRERRQRIQRLEARAEVIEERIEEEPEPEPAKVSHETPRPSLAPLIAELQTIRSEIRALRLQDDEEAMTMLLVA